MSEFTKLVKSEAGTLKVEFLHCDNCGKREPKNSTFIWITTSTSLGIQQIGNPPLTGDFCGPACVSAYYAWQSGDPIPQGALEAARIKAQAIPRYEIRQDGHTLYRGHNNEIAMRHLERHHLKHKA